MSGTFRTFESPRTPIPFLRGAFEKVQGEAQPKHAARGRLFRATDILRTLVSLQNSSREVLRRIGVENVKFRSGGIEKQAFFGPAAVGGERDRRNCGFLGKKQWEYKEDSQRLRVELLSSSFLCAAFPSYSQVLYSVHTLDTASHAVSYSFNSSMKTRIPKQRAPEESCAMGGHKLNYYVVLRSLGASVSRLMKLFLPPPSSSINHTHPSFSLSRADMPHYS